MEKILGPAVGNFIRRLHEEHGVTFHLGTTATAIDRRSVTLKGPSGVAHDCEASICPENRRVFRIIILQSRLSADGKQESLY
jgi:hypothetical protein